ncbi:exosortase B [Methylophilus rhizosphaerae]|uniref:Exosortase B n=2 Tax=Methylophilus rhizosphaerae TaxID=492660 RepID=A0A1G8Z165_9PROT|nr:exosortase B [Methylophilus rhizosphaerae]
MIVFIIVCYLIATKLPALQTIKPRLSLAEKGVGGFFLLAGLLAYIIGRSQHILLIELGSQVPVLLGALWILFGFKQSRPFLFPAFFILFMLPIPQVVLSTVTLPMKIAVSTAAEWITYYTSQIPVAREGVLLFVGQYRLFVADACAGMHTLISLEALGLLYLNLVHSKSLIRNSLLAILIVPISFSANVIRVVILIFITYYLGDEVAQSYLHEFAGFVLFTIALFLIITCDSLIQWAVKRAGR